jgi:hypothetical protein
MNLTLLMGFVVVRKDERVVIVVPRSSELRWFPHFHACRVRGLHRHL